MNIIFWYIASAIAVGLIPPKPVPATLVRVPFFLLCTILFVVAGYGMGAGVAFGTFGIVAGILFGLSISKNEKTAA